MVEIKNQWRIVCISHKSGSNTFNYASSFKTDILIVAKDARMNVIKPEKIIPVFVFYCRHDT
jgi:hypothetical protein